jgi:ABC-type Fe3+/spermidine/putrescine transport system ATPase subunit
MPLSAEDPKSSRGGAVSVRDLRRSFGPVKALDGVSLEIAAGEFFALLGPSGCGKTTLLRILAGLDSADSGEVFLDGTALTAPAHERPINTVFQSYALFPHLSVRENVAFGLRMKKRPADEIARRVEAAMKLVEIGNLAERKPSEISGGQKQRVALARALINEPQVLLLDEPLAAVDQKLRKQLQTELKALQRRLGLTFIYVTHDQEEALSLSDRLAVLNHGSVEQVGTAREVYEHPRTRFVAEFIGNCNFVEAEITEAGAQTSFGLLQLTTKKRGKATIYFRPERILIDDGFDAEVVEVTFVGAEAMLTVRSGSELLKIATRDRFAAGQKISITIPPEAIGVF